MTAKTWNEVFTRLDAFFDGFSADVRAVADVDGTDEAEVRSLRATLEAAEVEVGRLKRERDVLPTPDADNPAHLRWAADAIVAHARSLPGSPGNQRNVVAETLREAADRLEAAQAEKSSVDELMEKAARVMREASSNRHAFQNDPPWEKESQHVRAAWIATARALYAAGLLTNPERSTES